MSKLNLYYSEQEIKLFKDLGWTYLFTGSYVENPIEPWAMYQIAAEQAFINNLQGPIIDALRKGIKAITECKPYRKTPEFEELIKYNEDDTTIYAS